VRGQGGNVIVKGELTFCSVLMKAPVASAPPAIAVRTMQDRGQWDRSGRAFPARYAAASLYDAGEPRPRGPGTHRATANLA
jgi:hypothetical protein